MAESSSIYSKHQKPQNEGKSGVFLRVLCLLVFSVIALRLVQVQVLQRGYYREMAQEEHLRRWELKADRGNIFIKDRTGVVPLAINSSVYNLSASPRDMKDNFGEVADKISKITGLGKNDLVSSLEKNAKKGYVNLAKRLSVVQAREITKLNVYGLFLESIPQREYPEGRLASQVLGFVNTEGEGQYGVEQYYDKVLAGKAGSLKSLATADGAPLLLPGEEETVETPAEQGKDIVLSLDRGLQSHIEEMARAKQTEYGAKSVSVMIMKAETGKILAMAGAPDFDPLEYFKTKDVASFRNPNVSDAEELGSIIKVLTMTTGVNEGVVSKDTTYNNTNSVQVDDRVIKNATGGNVGTLTMTDVIKYSLNTGVVFTLKQLGGGDINHQAKDRLYSYFTGHFNLGSPTGVDLYGEAGGLLYGPDDMEGNRVRYANMTFGHGMTVTPVQAASALASIMNGGSYIKPSVVESIDGQKAQPEVIKQNVVTPETRDQIKYMMSQASYLPRKDGYLIGGKTGTAQLLQEDGTYSQTRERGTAYGFLSSGDGTYIVMIKVEDPAPAFTHFASAKAAIPIFTDTMNWLVDYYQPKKLAN